MLQNTGDEAPEMKSFALTVGSANVGDSKDSSGSYSMTRGHGKLINTANPLDLFQLTVLGRTMWNMQLTKASGWLIPHPPVSLLANLGSESNSKAVICALTVLRLWIWCSEGLLSLYCNYWDGLLLLVEWVQGLTQRGNMQESIMKRGMIIDPCNTLDLYDALHCCSWWVLYNGITHPVSF